MDAAYALASYVCSLKYEDIPAVAMDACKKAVLDWLGVGVAGSTMPECVKITQLVEEWAGRPESTILTRGTRVPAPNAALANGAMVISRDYDDTHDGAMFHPGSSVITASLAMAERRGKVSGKDLITAAAAGYDVACRMALAIARRQGPEQHGWQVSCVVGPFAAAAAAGKLLHLDEARMLNAFGIAYCQAAGNIQVVADAGLTKALQVGNAPRAGVISALLAERGLTGSKNTLEGQWGFYNVYFRGNYDQAAITEELGSRFEVANLSFKPYPCCRFNHVHIDAALRLRRSHEIQPEEIEEVVVSISRQPHLCVDPIDIKRKPRNPVDAQFSLPYTVATALVKGKVTLDDFTESVIKDPAILGIAARVNPKINPDFVWKEERKSILDQSIVEVKLSNGTVHRSDRVDYPYGSPQAPFSWDDLVNKFRDCAAHAARPIKQSRIDEITAAVKNLEQMDDVSQLMRL